MVALSEAQPCASVHTTRAMEQLMLPYGWKGSTAVVLDEDDKGARQQV